MEIIEAFIIDEEGFLIDKIVVDLDNHEENPLVIINPYDYKFYKARWLNGEWVDAESRESREARELQELLESSKPTNDELEDASLEIKIITLLLEMGLV